MLADKCNNDGICICSFKELQNDTELSKDAVIRNIKALEEADFIQVKKAQDNLRNWYKLEFINQLSENSDINAKDVIADKKKSKKGKLEIDFHIPDNFSAAMQDAISDWIEYKKQLPKQKQYQTQIGWDKFIKILANYLENLEEKIVIERIDKAIAGGWVGLNLDKLIPENQLKVKPANNNDEDLSKYFKGLI